jgi:hypothetical protein
LAISAEVRPVTCWGLVFLVGKALCSPE